MIFTNDLSTLIGKLRLLIPDNDESNYLFSDEDLQAFLDIANNNITLARIQIYYTLSAKYLGESNGGGTVQIGPIKIDEDVQLGRKYLELAKRLEDAYNQGLNIDLFPSLFATGINCKDNIKNTELQENHIIKKKSFNSDLFRTEQYINSYLDI